MNTGEPFSVICKLDVRASAAEPTAYNSPLANFDTYPDSLYGGHADQEPSVHWPRLDAGVSNAKLVCPLSSEPPRQTATRCMWCMHSFDTVPVGMPVSRAESGRHIVSGVFCSMECASAHNFDRHHASHVAYTRHAMLCEVASKASTTKPVTIRPAPPREMLDTFGGPLSIEEFRSSNRPFTVVYPLHVIAQPHHSEEVSFPSGGSSVAPTRGSRFVPIDEDTIDAFTSGLRRPTNNRRGYKSTLDYMRSSSTASAGAGKSVGATSATAVP